MGVLSSRKYRVLCERENGEVVAISTPTIVADEAIRFNRERRKLNRVAGSNLSTGNANTDDDNDGLSDWFENNDGNDMTGQFDHDNDGVEDHLDADDDGDGILDEYEV